MKKRNYFSTSAVLFLTLCSQVALANEKFQSLLKNFPICYLNSSLGQFCKYKKEEFKASFSLIDIADSKAKLTHPYTLTVDTDEWHYHLALQESGENHLTIIFTDDAKRASYHVTSDYHVRLTKGGDWEIYSKKITYMCCSPEDATNLLNKTILLKPPVRFLKR